MQHWGYKIALNSMTSINVLKGDMQKLTRFVKAVVRIKVGLNKSRIREGGFKDRPGCLIEKIQC